MLPQAQLESLCKSLDSKVSQGYEYLRVRQIRILNGVMLSVYFQLPSDLDTLFIVNIYPSGEIDESQA